MREVHGPTELTEEQQRALEGCAKAFPNGFILIGVEGRIYPHFHHPSHEPWALSHALEMMLKGVRDGIRASGAPIPGLPERPKILIAPASALQS